MVAAGDADERIEKLEHQLARKTREASIVQGIVAEINATLDLDRIFDIILGTLDEVLEFHHSMVLLANESEAALEIVASHGYPEPGIGASVEIGKGVIGVVAKRRKVMRVVGMGAQAQYVASARREMERAGERLQPPVALPGLPDARSQVAIPLVARERLIGVFAVESPHHGAFDALDEAFLSVVGHQVAIAIANARAYHDQLELSEAFSRFVPREFLSLLGHKSIVDVGLGDRVQREMAVVFSDIRSFTTLSEQMSPEQNFHFVNDFLQGVAPAVLDHGGVIDKYIGDAIMAIFPYSVDDAFDAALKMQQKVCELSDDRISVGVGIHWGPLMLGVVGFADRMEGTVIGDTVNLAARLEGLTKDLARPVVASEQAVKRLRSPERFETTFLREVQVKGKVDPVRVHAVAERDPP